MTSRIKLVACTAIIFFIAGLVSTYIFGELKAEIKDLSTTVDTLTEAITETKAKAQENEETLGDLGDEVMLLRRQSQ